MEKFDEEFEADRFALLICMGVMNNGVDKNLNYDIIYSGCEIALLIFDGLEKIGFKAEKTHPSTSERLSRLRKNLRDITPNKKTYSSIVKFASGNSKIYEKMLSIITQPSNKQEKYFSEKANDIVNKIVTLLDKCSDSNVPDYFTFYEEMIKIFDVGYHHKIIDKVFEVGQSFFSDINQYKNGSKQLNNSVKKNFFKFKLFYGFIGQLAEPAQSLFKQKLRETAQ